jgi:hypothetical protein
MAKLYDDSLRNKWGYGTPLTSFGEILVKKTGRVKLSCGPVAATRLEEFDGCEDFKVAGNLKCDEKP